MSGVYRGKCWFLTFKPTYLWNGARGCKLLLITNRNMYTRFRLVPKSMTLKGNSLCNITRLPFEDMNKDRPVLPRRKCSAVIVLCEDIRVMPIFVGVRWMDRGQQIMSGVVENCHFCFLWSLYLSKVHIWDRNYYVSVCSPSMAFHRH